jgi:hypothetical protein
VTVDRDQTRLTKAQVRVLDYLRADTSGTFINVPISVNNDVRTFDRLEALGLIEKEWVLAAGPPGSFTMVYRAVA